MGASFTISIPPIESLRSMYRPTTILNLERPPRYLGLRGLPPRLARCRVPHTSTLSPLTDSIFLFPLLWEWIPVPSKSTLIGSRLSGTSRSTTQIDATLSRVVSHLTNIDPVVRRLLPENAEGSTHPSPKIDQRCPTFGGRSVRRARDSYFWRSYVKSPAT